MLSELHIYNHPDHLKPKSQSLQFSRWKIKTEKDEHHLVEGHTTVSFNLFGVTQVFCLFLWCLFLCFSVYLPKMGGKEGEEKHTGILIPK